MKLLKNKGFIFVFFLAAGFLVACGGGGGGGGTTAVSCTSYTPMSAAASYKISVKEAGIYLISPPTLKTFCLDSSNAPLTGFKLQNFDPNMKNTITKGIFDVPISYDPAGNIEFYGVGVNRNDYTASNADYTETNVYWLVPATTTALMATKSSVPNGTQISPMTTFHMEQNNIWWDSMTGGTAAGYDHWFWDKVVSKSQFYTFTINNYDPFFSDSLKFSAYLHSQAPPSPHQISGQLNTIPLTNANSSWSTSTPYIYSTSLVQNFIANGIVNNFQFTVTSTTNFTTDEIYFNWLELEYPGKALNDQLIFHGNIPGPAVYSFSVNGFSQNSIELFDISDPKNPKKFNTISPSLIGTGYQLSFGDTLNPGNNYIALAPAQRKTPVGIVPVTSRDLTPAGSITGTYYYVMITHESLNSGIQPLATYRTNQGFKVITVNTGDVYDSYSGGIFTPQAIQDFLADVNTRWSATYALLVGDASVDYKNYLGYGQENLVPTYLTDYYYGQTPSDFWFVPKSGAQYVPAMAIGRLPAKNMTELNVMVNKIINYEGQPKASWNHTLSFVAADSTIAPFDTDSETLVSTIQATTNGPNFTYNRYYNGTPNPSISSSFYYADSGKLKSAIIPAINSGTLITNYFGHGSVDQWANGYLGNLQNPFLTIPDVTGLVNSGQLTFLVTLDCLNGYFAGYGEGQLMPNPLLVQYNPYSIAEIAVKASGGAVASFSPTGQGFTSIHLALAQALYPIILNTLPGPPCGPSGCTNTTALPPNTIGAEIQTAETTFLSSNPPETVNIFVLLGDPATQLQVP